MSIIRTAKSEEDMDKFFRLSFDTAKTTEGRWFDQLTKNNPDKSEEELRPIHRKEMEDYCDFGASDVRVFIAENDGDFAGYIWIGLRNSEDFCDFQQPMWIYDIVVDPKFRGNGLGKMLIQRAEEFAIELGQNIGLFVHTYNKTAIRLYDSQGYYIKIVPMSKPNEKVSNEHMISDFVIQEITENDLEDIKELGLESFKRRVLLSKDANNEQIPEKYNEFYKRFDSSEDKHHMFVAVVDEKFVGFVWIGIAYFSDQTGLIYDLVIEEKYKGKGLEQILVNYAEVWSKKIGLLSTYYPLHTRSDITSGLLISQGYSVPGYFMEKDLVRKIESGE
ncbi:MAG: GNAT family N-acetyltransferase [Candidatus Thorarchaeota archaeon]